MSAPTGVPLRLSSFIGRKKELGELRRLLAHTRLLTILGPGGAGKTCLATEFARMHASRSAHKAVMVELVEVRDPSLIPDAIARAVGISLQAEDTIGTLVLLQPSPMKTACAYKGPTSQYWRAATNEGLLHDVAWCYEDPAPEVAGIAGMVAFFNERVDAIYVDGEEMPRPLTTWRHPAAPSKHNEIPRPRMR